MNKEKLEELHTLDQIENQMKDGIDIFKFG